VAIDLVSQAGDAFALHGTTGRGEGNGQSAQSSLKAMGKSHGDVIALALTEVLGPP
jgi:hypothetical protein